MNNTATTKTTALLTVASIKEQPNHIECKSVAAALEQTRRYMRENYNYAGPVKYEKLFTEGTTVVYAFKSTRPEANLLVYVIF